MSLKFFFFFFNDTATTEIYTLSLHDALPISARWVEVVRINPGNYADSKKFAVKERSEEHTSELQSPCNLVCRLLLEKKKNKIVTPHLHLNKLFSITRAIPLLPEFVPTRLSGC